MTRPPSLPGGRSLVAVIVGVVVALPQAGAEPFPLGSDAWLKQAYGLGVQSFFSGDYQRAYDELTDVVAAASAVSVDSVDPRVLYFRGLAARRLGRFDEAEADFARGAVLEADATGDWPVGRSLERVQGPDRLALERYRIRSRIARAHAKDDDPYSGLSVSRESTERTRGPRRGTGTRSEFGVDQGGSAGLPAEDDTRPAADRPEELPPGPAADSGTETPAEATDGERVDTDPADQADEPMAEDPAASDTPSEDEFKE